MKRHDILVELDHFESTEIEESLKGFFSKNPRDTRVIHTIMRNRQRMKNDVIECLRSWQRRDYYEVCTE